MGKHRAGGSSTRPTILFKALVLLLLISEGITLPVGMASLNDSWGVFGFIGKKLEFIKTLIENNYIHYGMPPCRLLHDHCK